VISIQDTSWLDAVCSGNVEDAVLALDGASSPVPGISWAKRAVEMGLVSSLQEYKDRLHDVSMDLARLKAAIALRGEDIQVILAVRCLDRVLEASNETAEAFSNWADVNRASGRAEKLPAPTVLVDGETRVRELEKLRCDLEDFIDESMRKAFPNVSMVAGTMLGARLLESCGGIDRLSRMPAGTIQVLGADTALFRHLSRGSPPPKHGLIFQHPLIKEARSARRGRVARLLSCNIALAARLDCFSGELSDRLQTKFQNDVNMLRGEKYGG